MYAYKDSVWRQSACRELNFPTQNPSSLQLMSVCITERRKCSWPSVRLCGMCPGWHVTSCMCASFVRCEGGAGCGEVALAKVAPVAERCAMCSSTDDIARWCSLCRRDRLSWSRSMCARRGWTQGSEAFSCWILSAGAVGSSANPEVSAAKCAHGLRKL